MIEIRSLSHRYDEREALRDVSFDVAAGSVFALLGPNGGGKSTLFRILTTLLTPTAGQAAVHGFDVVRDRAEVRRRIGVVFQSPSLDGKLTVAENLTHQGHLYGLSGSLLRERAAAAAERMHVADRAGDRVDTLSGGLKRRVELAKCLLHRPPVLLLDEPSTGLDPGARSDMMEHLLQLAQGDGVTVLLTTHLMDEADRCDRVAILDEGRLVALDSPSILKSTVGGDVLTLESAEAPALAAEVSARLGCAATAHDGAVRIEHRDAAGLLPGLFAAYPGRIDRVTLGRPTLDDVFLDLTGPPPAVGPARTRQPGGSIVMQADARAITWLPAWSLARREVVRFLRQRSRVVGALLTPVVFWLLIGSGLGRSFRLPGQEDEVHYLEYFFPGSTMLIVLFTAVFATISVIEDRREGFLQSVLASPSPRWAIVMGKVLGSTALAVGQALLFLLLGPLAGVPLSVGSFAATAAMLVASGAGLSALGLLIAWRMESTQGFHAIMNLVLIPMWLLSGALFPASGAAAWIRWVIMLNPLTYGVAGVRQTIYLGAPVGGDLPPLWLCIVVTVAFAGAMIAVVSREVSRQP
jgi:ABC-2 type transport system ATP-binding protein